MHILVTGGTGFLGSALCPALLADGHELTLLSRRPQKVFAAYGRTVTAIRHLDDLGSDVRIDAVINLAGEGIADRPWTSQRKAELHASRVTLTEELVSWIRRTSQRPKVMISGSAVGWYGDQGDTILEEQAPPHVEYLHTLCNDWEQAARGVEKLGVRLCIVRTGLVISRSGGLLKRMLPVFGLGLGGKLGTGEQWISWIALSDYVEIIRFLLQQENLSGVFNATAPKPVTNAELAGLLARAVKRPAFLTIPAGVLKLTMGEMSALLLTGQRVLPSRLLEQKFFFDYRTLDDVLRAEVGG
jgi:uncharacterized protein (TIGR01777 family)